MPPTRTGGAKATGGPEEVAVAPGEKTPAKAPSAVVSRLRHAAIRLHHGRCGALLAALLAFLLLLPFVYHSTVGRLGLFALYVAALIAVVRSLRPRGWALSLNIGLGGLYFVLVTAGALTGLLWVKQVALLAAIAFLLGVMLALLRYVMDFSRVTADKLFGAVGIYMLIAFVFADVYVLMEYINPGNFRFSEKSAGDIIDWSDFLYFSFTVLTSTGFGEITPVSRLARSVVILQEVAGVMYVAFLIARLTELYPSREGR